MCRKKALEFVFLAVNCIITAVFIAVQLPFLLELALIGVEDFTTGSTVVRGYRKRFQFLWDLPFYPRLAHIYAALTCAAIVVRAFWGMRIDGTFAIFLSLRSVIHSLIFLRLLFTPDKLPTAGKLPEESEKPLG